MADEQIYRMLYVDSSGEQSERLISNVTPQGMDEILAYCHLRNAQRTFKLSKVVRLMDAETGEVVADPWSHFGVVKGVHLPIALVPSIRALKHLTDKLRPGGRKRERDHLVSLAEKLQPHLDLSKQELDFQIKKLWVDLDGEDQYRRDLESIPVEWMPLCRQTALTIAKGSGRKPVNPLALNRIDVEFPSSGNGRWAGMMWPSVYDGPPREDLFSIPPKNAHTNVRQSTQHRAGRLIHIDPKDHFSAWAYQVIPELWPALGVDRREYVDKEKTRLLRNATRESGEADKANLTRIKVTYLSYVIDAPPNYDFQEGDIF